VRFYQAQTIENQKEANPNKKGGEEENLSLIIFGCGIDSDTGGQRISMVLSRVATCGVRGFSLLSREGS